MSTFLCLVIVCRGIVILWWSCSGSTPFIVRHGWDNRIIFDFLCCFGRIVINCRFLLFLNFRRVFTLCVIFFRTMPRCFLLVSVSFIILVFNTHVGFWRIIARFSHFSPWCLKKYFRQFHIKCDQRRQRGRQFIVFNNLEGYCYLILSGSKNQSIKFVEIQTEKSWEKFNQNLL